ncbi:MAG: response regulator [Candidatus Binatia bacterium]
MREVDAEVRVRTDTPEAQQQRIAPEEISLAAGSIAHDLNNLLAIVLGHTELAAKAADIPASVHASLVEIGNAAERGKDLVTQLRALSRLNARPAAAASSGSQAQPLPERAATAEVAMPVHRHILFLDDDKPLVYLAVQALKALGHRVSGFDSVAKALAALRDDPPAYDMVVTDYTMPEASGIEVATQISRIRPDLPVLLMSGAVSDELRATCQRLAVCQVVEKPVSMQELCETIHSVACTLAGARG